MMVPAKKRPSVPSSKSVAALEAQIRPEDARPRIDMLTAWMYQALMALARGEDVVSIQGRKGRKYVFGPLRQELPAHAADRLHNQGLICVWMRKAGEVSYQLTEQGEAVAAFACERFPEGRAYPTLKYVRTYEDREEDEAFRFAFERDQERAQGARAKRREEAA